MTVRIGMNGFGRVGRAFLRTAHERGLDLEIAAINSLADGVTLGRLLRRDSVFGLFAPEVKATSDELLVDGVPIRLFAEKDPVSLPWGDLGIDLVVEMTGKFTAREKAALHLAAGAPRVIVAAPSKGSDATFVIGVNEDTFDARRHVVVSNGLCTTNCLVPMIKVLDDAFGVEHGLLSTIHAYTADQVLVDGPHKDARRGRAAALNIIPTSSGAARATGLVLESMEGRLDGLALRVPVPDGSLTDFVALLRRDITVAEVNEAFRAAATTGRLAPVLDYVDEPLVSSDVIGSAASCLFDSQLTKASGPLVKVFGWYDNEWGYSNRLAELALLVGTAAARAGSPCTTNTLHRTRREV